MWRVSDLARIHEQPGKQQTRNGCPENEAQEQVPHSIGRDAVSALRNIHQKPAKQRKHDQNADRNREDPKVAATQ